jgi:hypothetical protein
MTRTARRFVPLVFAAALVGPGCENKPPAPAPAAPAVEKPAAKAPAAPAAPAGARLASCNVVKNEGMCREYGAANLAAAGEPMIKDLCTKNLQGEYKAEACPAPKRIGSCTTPEGTKVYYSDGPLPWTVEKAEKSCKEGIPAGTWKAGPAGGGRAG